MVPCNVDIDEQILIDTKATGRHYTVLEQIQGVMQINVGKDGCWRKGMLYRRSECTVCYAEQDVCSICRQMRDRTYAGQGKCMAYKLKNSSKNVNLCPFLKFIKGAGT